MAYRISAAPEPVRKYLDVLDAPETSEEERTYVVIRHANGHDQLLVEEVTTGTSFTYDIAGYGKVREYKPVAFYLDIARKVFCVLQECNIEDEAGKRLFRPKATWAEFMKAWASLPQEARDAIFDRVVEVNPHWGNW